MTNGVLNQEERKNIVFVERLDQVIDVKQNLNASIHSNTFGTTPESVEKDKPPQRAPVQILYQKDGLKPEFRRGSFPRSIQASASI